MIVRAKDSTPYLLVQNSETEVPGNRCGVLSAGSLMILTIRNAAARRSNPLLLDAGVYSQSEIGV